MEKKVQCFKCLNKFSYPKDLFVHIKDVHKICGKSKYSCTLCGETFTHFGTYKTHVQQEFNEMDVEDEETISNRNEFIEAYNAVAMGNEDVEHFKELVEKAAFEIACKLNAVMILPRDLVYKTILDFDKFLKTVIINGMNRIVLPRVLSSEKGTVREFMNVIVSSFSNFTTESNFDKKLSETGLIEPIVRCALFDNVEDDESSSILMPVSFQIKKFLEMPGVFQKIQDNTANILQKGKLNHFINGSLWKEKVQNYSKDQIVMPYHYYSDGAQLNHPLGPHCRTGQEDFHYYSFPTIPTQYQSRLENIFLLYLHPETYINQFGLEQIFGIVIEELTKLATDGIVINVDSKEYEVFFVCGLFLADTKEANICLGFQRSPNAIKYCRFCQMSKDDTQYTPSENPEIRRDRQNYDEDVLIHNAKRTGVREYSTLNSIPYFHVTESSAEDITHTVDEGIVKYNIPEALHFLIYDDDNPPFTLDQLNARMKDFSYGEEEKANKPHLISENNLDNSNLKMSAAETANFVHNLTFMIGDLVPESSPAWYLILLTVKFFDYCYLPCYDNVDIEEWRTLIEEMNNSYIHILGQHMKPHHHLGIHLPTDTLKYGPLRYARTIRFEGKHRELKGYAKNSNNRIHLSYSIAKKTQYNLADRLLQSRGLEDIIEAKYMLGTIKEKVYYAKLKSSLHKDRLTQQKCYFTDKVTVNGMTFSRDMWLPDVADDGNRQINRIHKICDIVLLNPPNINDFFIICKTYDTWPNEHYASYEIDESSLHSEFGIINIGDFLENHHYPVKTHKIGEKVMFRCKRF